MESHGPYSRLLHLTFVQCHSFTSDTAHSPMWHCPIWHICCNITIKIQGCWLLRISRLASVWLYLLYLSTLEYLSTGYRLWAFFFTFYTGLGCTTLSFPDHQYHIWLLPLNLQYHKDFSWMSLFWYADKKQAVKHSSGLLNRAVHGGAMASTGDSIYVKW